VVWCDGEASESVLARYFDPKLGRFLTQDSYLGQIDEPPSLHRYLYANANPLFFTDPTGHYSRAEFASDLKWGKDFASAFFGDLAENAGRRAVKVGEAVVTNAAHMVVETGAQAHDVLVLAADAAKRTATGEGFDEINLWSETARASGEAFAEGKSTSDVILGNVKNVAVSTLSAGIVPTVQEQYSALADFAAGKATIEDVEDRLANAAGGAILNAGLASYASARLGYGWRGQPLSAEVAQLAQRGSSIAKGVKGLAERGFERLHEGIGRNDFTTIGRIEPRVRSESVSTLKSIRRHTERLVRGNVKASNPAIARQVRSIQRAISREQFGRAGTRYHSLNFRLVREAQAKGFLRDVIVDRSVQTPLGIRRSRRPDYRVTNGEILDIKPWRNNPKAFDLTDQFQDLLGATGEMPIPLYYRLW